MSNTISLSGWTINKNGSFSHKERNLKLVRVKDNFSDKYYYKLYKEGNSKEYELFSTPFQALLRAERSPKFKGLV